MEIMSDPVQTPGGVTYERKYIEEYIEREGTDPMTREPLSKDDLTPNRALKSVIEEYRKQEETTTGQ